MIRGLAWTYKAWSGKLPSTGTDEMFRHTLVLPNPFVVTEVDEEDGTTYHPALIIVTAPWWFCRYALKAEYRRETREERKLNRELMAEDA